MKKIITIFISLAFLSARAQTITTIAGNGTVGFTGEGSPAISAEFGGPCGVATDKLGNIYIADWANNVVQKIDNTGILTRFAGSGVIGSGGDGGPATAAELALFLSVGIAVDTAGNVFFANGSDVRKVNTSGIISTVVGTGSYGSSGDGGPASAAELKSVTGICFDKLGNLYIADQQGSKIRKVNVTGSISTFAGTTFGFSGDGGPATDAQLKSPVGIVADDIGNIYFTDPDEGRIRKIDTSGIINAVAGISTAGITTCQGCSTSELQIYGCEGLAIDHNNNLYVSVLVYNVVHKITTDGKAYTVAGTGASGYNGDNIAATTAELTAPSMICLDNNSNLLIADKNNHRIRKVDGSITAVRQVPVTVPQLSVYPNPVTHNQFTCTITTATNEQASIIITDILGQVLYTSSATTNKASVITLKAPPGLYQLTAATTTRKMTASIVVE